MVLYIIVLLARLPTKKIMCMFVPFLWIFHKDRTPKTPSQWDSIKTQLPAAHWATKICLKKSPQAVIVPERLSGMLGGRPEIAEYFLNAYHDMYLGVMELPRGPREMGRWMSLGRFFFGKQVHWWFSRFPWTSMTSKQFSEEVFGPPENRFKTPSEEVFGCLGVGGWQPFEHIACISLSYPKSRLPSLYNNSSRSWEQW